MGNWDKQQEARKDTKEKNKVRRETLAKYLYDLSKVTFTGLVVGSFATLFSKESVNIDYVIIP